jgi:hypothetical protein
MYNYIVITQDHYNHNRNWIKCETLEQARKLAGKYRELNHFDVEIYSISKDLMD